MSGRKHTGRHVDSNQHCEVADALLALDLARGLGFGGALKMIDALGSAEAVLASSPTQLSRRLGITSARGAACAASLREGAQGVDREREAMARVGCTLVELGSPNYPALLATIPNPPLLLRVRGVMPGSEPDTIAACIAIVGSRRPTASGCRHAARFARFFAEAGFHVVSGGARGIDAAAHRAALELERPTCAILGSGLGRLYPPEHEALFESIVERGGCLASEYPVDTPPRPARFPERNRIVSGLSLGVLVVEAAARSGALITARLAVEEHGREAMALPGRIDDRASAGCLRMLREGWAALVRSPEEALETLEGAQALLKAARSCS